MSRYHITNNNNLKINWKLKNKENLNKFYNYRIDGQQLDEEILDCRTLPNQSDMKISKSGEFFEFILHFLWQC